MFDAMSPTEEQIYHFIVKFKKKETVKRFSSSYVVSVTLGMTRMMHTLEKVE